MSGQKAIFTKQDPFAEMTHFRTLGYPPSHARFSYFSLQVNFFFSKSQKIRMQSVIRLVDCILPDVGLK